MDDVRGNFKERHTAQHQLQIKYTRQNKKRNLAMKQFLIKLMISFVPFELYAPRPRIECTFKTRGQNCASKIGHPPGWGQMHKICIFFHPLLGIIFRCLEPFEYTGRTQFPYSFHPFSSFSLNTALKVWQLLF